MNNFFSNIWWDIEEIIYVARDEINCGLLIILIIGLALGTYIIYHKHKGENIPWKKILKWVSIFFFIIAIIWVIISIIHYNIMAIGSID